ncbi:MAG: RDD family protein [Pirellulales bacterium]|nr:RDD family protein [Pirellulales bacterium]
MDAGRKPLDARVEIVTPENIAFEYRVAGPFRRLAAYLVDVAIRLGVAIAAFVVSGVLFGFVGLWDIGAGIALVFAFLLTWFYGGLFETIWNGQTPGKRAMGIRVLTSDGRAINALQAVMRNVLRDVDFFCLFGLITMAMNRRFQRLGDLACGTMVVIEEPQWMAGVVHVTDPAVLRLAAELPAGFQPSRSLARALATYVGRRAAFPPMRRMQIAAHLALPLQEILGVPPQADADRLLCALYHRTFVTDRLDEIAGPRAPVAPRVVESGNPFAQPDQAPLETMFNQVRST